jgi:hypothetical protein
VRGVGRVLLAFFGLTIFASLLLAQKEEGRLVDRLLRPDLSLQNSQQNKKFGAVESSAGNKEFEANSYSRRKERPTKSLLGIPDFLAGIFETKKFPGADGRANAATRATPAYVQRAAVTKKSTLAEKPSQAHKVADTLNYPDNRPFLGKGTRQEILSQLDHPLTIEEVRELLNRDQPPTDSP